MDKPELVVFCGWGFISWSFDDLDVFEIKEMIVTKRISKESMGWGISNRMQVMHGYAHNFSHE